MYLGKMVELGATAAGLAVGAQPAQRVPPSGPGFVSSRC